MLNIICTRNESVRWNQLIEIYKKGTGNHFLVFMFDCKIEIFWRQFSTAHPSSKEQWRPFLSDLCINGNNYLLQASDFSSHPLFCSTLFHPSDSQFFAFGFFFFLSFFSFIFFSLSLFPSSEISCRWTRFQLRAEFQFKRWNNMGENGANSSAHS